MSQGAASFTIQLNSATSEKAAGEHYIRRLDPPIRVPYLANPRAMLEGLSFSNTFSNVDTTYGNNKVKLAWYSHTVGTRVEGGWKNMELTVDTGYYDLPSLEAALARKMKAASVGAPTYSFDKQTETIGSNLWDTMDTYCAANPAYNLDDKPGENRAHSIVTFDARCAIVSGSTSGGDVGSGYQNNVFSQLPAGRLLIPVKKLSLQLWKDVAFTQPPEWLIGARLNAMIYSVPDEPHARQSAIGSNGGFGVTRRVVAIHKMPKTPSIKKNTFLIF